MNVNMFSSVIVSTIEMTNFLPLAAVVVCVGAMIMFLAKAAVILRVQTDDALRPPPMANAHNVQVPRLKMTRVHIPFTFRLLETGNNTFEEIRLAVSSQVKYTLQAFWAVSIRDLHMSLWRTWNELREQANRSAIVNAMHCQQSATNVRCQQPHSEKVVVLKSPKPPLVLGAPPRLAYPLVVFMIRETESDELLHPDETVILVNVVHLRDPVCPLPTSILAQYLKQASGQLSCLKQLYLATGDPSSTDEGSTGHVAGSLSLAEPVACTDNTGPLLCTDSILRDCPGIEQLCVVCHYFPLSRALLPCRHTCICAVCFSKLDRCPMCRAAITSYFCIRTEEYVPPSTLEPKVNSKSKVAVHWLDALNDRLTDFLGFR